MSEFGSTKTTYLARPGSAERFRQLADARRGTWLGEGSSSVQQQALRAFDRAVASWRAAVDPRYTSQTCHRCGTVDPGARESQARFRCRACGHRAHADVNAGNNVLAAGRAVTARGGTPQQGACETRIARIVDEPTISSSAIRESQRLQPPRGSQVALSLYEPDGWPELMSPAQVAKLVNMTPGTVGRWCEEGTIEAIKIGRVWRIPAQGVWPLVPPSIRARWPEGPWLEETPPPAA